jgi:aspartyl-tRNA(Asn)/glutamyl-tRNA(Gln) amidotransferase subunit C
VSTPLSSDDVLYVAKLARLNLTPTEVDLYTGQLAGMLEHFSDIEKLDLADVEPMVHPIPLVNVLRADVPGVCLDREEVLAAAPAADEGRFRVPPILGEAP